MGLEPLRASIVIPLHGGPEEIRACLDSLERCRDELHEVIVVDDVSPDDAPEVAAEYDWVQLIRLPENQGFAAACNTGYRASTGEVVIFLNSDTVVPRLAVSRMLETFGESDVAAVGPYSNSTAGIQMIDVPYRAIEDMFPFAAEFAQRGDPAV
jgi:GT2 family glycosyltransferase